MRPGSSVAAAQQIDAARLHVTHKKRAGRGHHRGPPAPPSERAKSTDGKLRRPTPPLCPALCDRLLGPEPPHGPTELVADPTMISPVFVSVPGRQPRIVHPPPVRLCRYT